MILGYNEVKSQVTIGLKYIPTHAAITVAPLYPIVFSSSSPSSSELLSLSLSLSFSFSF